MAIDADFTVTLAGDIRHSSGTSHYTVLELHRFLQDLADDPEASGDDLVDITSPTPSARSTDNIIDLLGTFNIDDDAAEYFYDGSITQAGGDTVYSGLRVLGAVNTNTTQLMVIQDNDIYQFTTTPASPFWGDQSTGGYNGVEAAGILMRCLIKSRHNGADFDGQRIRVQAREWFDTYDFFNVQLGTGESVAAVGTTPDAQNDTLQATVTAYSHVTNTEGYQQIDLQNGAGNKPYYSKWTYGADTSSDGLKGMFEYVKDLTGNGTAKTVHGGFGGELFLGITHDVPYTSGAAFTEDETLVWGTRIWYDGLLSGPFTPGAYVTIGALGAAGRVMYDDAVNELIIALEDTSITILDNDVITEYPGVDEVATSTTAAVDTGTGGGSAVLNNSDSGGSGIVLAATGTTTGNLYIQLLTGSAPVNTLPLYGITSTSAATSSAPVSKTVPKMFLGSYTGSLIGAYGIGVLDTDLTSSDSLQALDDSSQQPPNNVTFTLSGLEIGEDYVLIGPKDVGNAFDFAQLTNTNALTLGVGNHTSLTVDEAIPADTPSSGTLRVTLDDGRIRLIAYSSWTGSIFTVADESWIDPDDAGIGNGVMISYIDKLAASADETFTGVYKGSATQLWIRVRDGGVTPIKTFESPGTLGSSGGSAVAGRITDL